MPGMEDFNDSDFDSLAAEAAGEPAGEAEPAQETAQEQAQREAEYEYSASGKQIKEPISKILQRASQGYHYAQQMEDYNKRNQELNSKYKNYNEIDEYAKTNPDWWNHVESNWKNRQGFQPDQVQGENQPAEIDPSIKKFLDPIQKELSELKNFKSELAAREELKRVEQEDLALKSEIESIQKIYPGVDFKTPDAEGKSLELRVLEHAQREGISKFKVAFNDYYLDQIKSLEYERGKEIIAKDQQRKTKLGLLGSSPTPTKQVSRPTDYKNTSYGNLADEALQEMGL